jgi:Protein of unknown function (DUF2933)
METTNTQVTIPAPGIPSRRGTGQGIRGGLRGRRSLIIAGVIAAAATALVLGQHWLAAANLGSLLFILPCAAMMLMCMKGSHGQQTNAPPTSTQGGTTTP